MSEDTGVVDFDKFDKLAAREPVTETPQYKEGEYKEHKGDAYDAIETANQALGLGYDKTGNEILKMVLGVWKSNPEAKYDDPNAFKEILPKLQEAKDQIARGSASNQPLEEGVGGTAKPITEIKPAIAGIVGGAKTKQ